jgi:hypothetical protein
VSTNKFGLSRNIPPDIKYRIRKEAGFGCVICGLAIGTYEHIEPLWVDAKEHDANKMTFLCVQCQGKVSRGFMSKETVWHGKANPACVQSGRCHEVFDVGSDEFSIWVGGAKIEKVEAIISLDGKSLLSIKKPEQVGAPFRLSGIFHDAKDTEVLTITDNEWAASSDLFDIVCTAGKIGLRQDGDFVLKILCFPPHTVVFETIDMLYQGLRFKGDSSSFEVIGPNGGRVNVSGKLLTAVKDGCSLFSFFKN